MNRAHIPSFPNRIPCIDWQTYMPKFIDGNEDEVVLHLVIFHMNVCKLKVEFPKDCLMKIFMATLGDKARVWYEGLPEGSLCSLKYFHRVFFEHYGKSHLPLSLLQSCCDYCEGFISYLKGIDDIKCMDDEEIIRAFYYFSFQQQSKEANHFDT